MSTIDAAQGPPSDPVVLEQEGSRSAGGKQSITLEEILERYEVLDVEPTHMVVKAADAGTPDFREIGVTGSTQWGGFGREDYNPELRGQLGLRRYEQMRKGDGQVRSTLRLAKTPVLAARWYVKPASESGPDKKRGEFVWNNFTKWSSMSWPQFLAESLACLDFGFYSFEKVFDWHPARDNFVIWKKFAPRHPLDHVEWILDANGGPNGQCLINPQTGKEYDIPIDKLAVFTYDKEGGNLSGVSLLRSAYKHWYFKDTLYKIDAIQKERHGIGIPVIKLPPNFTPDDRTLANEMGRNLRSNEKAHIVAPPNWEIEFAQLNGNPVDCMKSVEHHDKQIAKNVLGEFMGLNGDAQGLQDLFMKASRYVADIAADVINKYCIPQLINRQPGWGNVDEYPQLAYRRLGDTTDWRTISFAIRNFIGADVMTPDDELEAWIREEMDTPAFDPETARKVRTPQAPGAEGQVPTEGAPGQPAPPNVGPPRQTPAVNSGQAKSAGSSKVGADGSGGN